ncbi:MAG: hypothetical protein ACRD29_05505 [Acidimicrobiales bacterium]
MARESRRHPDLRHGASVRAAIDFVDLLAGYGLDELDLDTLRFLACSAYAGKLRLRPAVGRTACDIVHEIIDAVLRRDFDGDVSVLVERATASRSGQPADTDGDPRSAVGEEGEVTLAGTGERPAPLDGPDEIPGLSRPGGSGKRASRGRCRWSSETDRRRAGRARPRWPPRSAPTFAASTRS